VDQRGAIYLHNKASILGSPKFFLSFFISFLVMEESMQKIINFIIIIFLNWEASHLINKNYKV